MNVTKFKLIKIAQKMFLHLSLNEINSLAILIRFNWSVLSLCVCKSMIWFMYTDNQ